MLAVIDEDELHGRLVEHLVRDYPRLVELAADQHHLANLIGMRLRWDALHEVRDMLGERSPVLRAVRVVSLDERPDPAVYDNYPHSVDGIIELAVVALVSDRSRDLMRRALWLIALGFTKSEAARLVGVSESMVSLYCRTARERLRESATA